jgi:FG-GAP-like repeat
MQEIYLAAGDFNGDGKLDLAITLTNFAPPSTNNTVVVWSGKGDGTFRMPVSSFEVGQTPVSVVAGDFYGDGQLDLAFAKYYSNTVTLLRNTSRQP